MIRFYVYSAKVITGFYRSNTSVLDAYRPFQILQTCLQNCQVRHREVELAEIGKIPLAVPVPVFVRQFLSERLYQFHAILSTLMPVSMIYLMSSTTCEKVVEIILLYSIFLCLFAKVRLSMDFTFFFLPLYLFPVFQRTRKLEAMANHACMNL